MVSSAGFLTSWDVQRSKATKPSLSGTEELTVLIQIAWLCYVGFNLWDTCWLKPAHICALVVIGMDDRNLDWVSNGPWMYSKNTPSIHHCTNTAGLLMDSLFKKQNKIDGAVPEILSFFIPPILLPCQTWLPQCKLTADSSGGVFRCVMLVAADVKQRWSVGYQASF